MANDAPAAMPGIVRKLLICASVNGVVVQAHGAVESHKAIRLSYKSGRIQECPADEIQKAKVDEQLEAHGLIGLLSIASSSFLIAITRREQVAQIFGKPIYVITDVAFLPLSSQQDALKAIRSAVEGRKSNEAAADSDFSDSDAEDDQKQDHSESFSSSPTDADATPLPKTDTGSSIARDVYAKQGQFGKFASQWLSRRGWSVGQATGRPQATTKVTEQPEDSAQGNTAAAPETEPASPDKHVKVPPPSRETAGSIDSMMPKILSSSRLILSSRSFFFSYDIDLTRRMGLLKGAVEAPTRSSLDPLYFWNKNLGRSLLDAKQDPFLMPIIQGFVGQRSFIVKKTDVQQPRSASVVSIDNPEHSDILSNTVAQAKEELSKVSESSQPYLLTVISRRSTKRSGLRYLRRGIDDEGNCANTVETEQILSAPDWDRDRVIRSFVQIRASIPLFFSQSPYSFKPLPQFHQSQAANDAAFKRHFADLKAKYGDVQIDLLVDKHGTEVAIGNAYEDTFKRFNEAGARELQGVDFEWFDFHAECRGMKFENVSKLVDKLKNNLDRYGETTVLSGVVQQSQKGIIRTNCMDCLDRTNVVESAFGQYMLQGALAAEGFEIDLVKDQSTTWFNTLWADNGDAISRQYAGTAALKGDFTRTRKRNMQGAMFDFSLTLTRYYNNMVNDYFSQAVIDVLLGNLTWKAFEDFESNMMSADPGISISKVRDHAIETCRRLVVQDETEDLIHGWTMLAPAHENTLRTLPFQEVVVLLTDAAVYCCKFDWTTEKVASFEKVDLRSISKIRHGVYITSTLTERQMDETLNAGLVVVYKPGKESIIRTNTRSLQNYVEPAANTEDRIDGGTGVLSWLAPRSPASSRALALKVIPATSDIEELQAKASSMPLAVAEEICREIERAMTGPKEKGAEGVKDLVEEGDIITLAEAKKRTGYLEHIGHSIKKLVWT